jgi:hypothetical protein
MPARNTSTQPFSATAISICGTRSAMESDCTSAANGSMSVPAAPRGRGTVQVGDVRRGPLAESDQHAAPSRRTTPSPAAAIAQDDAPSGGRCAARPPIRSRFRELLRLFESELRHG